MKKRLLLFTLTLLLISEALPVCALAFGGFVSPKGSGTYHEVYCYLVEGYSLNELLWYDSPSQAKSAGLTPCNECDAANGWEFSYDLDTYWKTDNHLFQSAMEIEYENGYEHGYENGYAEGYSEIDSDELMSYYDIGYDEGYDAGQKNGYDTGYDDGRASMNTEITTAPTSHQVTEPDNTSNSTNWWLPLILALLSILSTHWAEKTKYKKALELQKSNHEAKIKQLELTYSKERSAQQQSAHANMVSAVTEYMSKHDVNYKTSAETAIRQFSYFADENTRHILTELDSIISKSDPFIGPKNQTVKTLLSRIEDSLTP